MAAKNRPRRQIEEIVELHKRVGREEQEIFVEGLEDKFFYESFLDTVGLNRVAVLEINSVEIPIDEVLAAGFPDGNKGKVVILAAKLEGLVNQDEVVCIADADADRLLGRAYDFSLLLLTDYTSIEVYAFNAETLTRLLGVGLGGFPKSADEVLRAIADPLQEAFLVRVSGQQLKETLDLPDHQDFCLYDKKTSKVTFRSKDYTDRILRKAQAKDSKKKVGKLVKELRSKLQDDVRHQIDGHDFRCTLVWYLRKHPGFGALNPETLARTFLLNLDSAVLAKQPLFIELVRRLRSE